jgi:hypothetical protein
MMIYGEHANKLHKKKPEIHLRLLFSSQYAGLWGGLGPTLVLDKIGHDRDRNHLALVGFISPVDADEPEDNAGSAKAEEQYTA